MRYWKLDQGDQCSDQNKDRFVVRSVVPGVKQVKRQTQDEHAEGENTPDYGVYTEPFHPFSRKGVAFLIGMGNVQCGGQTVPELWNEYDYCCGNGEGV